MNDSHMFQRPSAAGRVTGGKVRVGSAEEGGGVYERSLVLQTR